MSPQNVYVVATSYPKEEPVILRIRNAMAVWLFSVARTSRDRVRAVVHTQRDHVGAVPCACPGSFFDGS